MEGIYGSGPQKIYTFQMPGEECFFFDHFFKLAGALILIFFGFGIYLAQMTVAESLLRAIVIVTPFVILYLFLGKRFADSVTLDFATKKVRFSFRDARGTIEKSFDEVKKVRFRFYLTFVLDDMKVMIKRPDNKKEIFIMLDPVFKIDRSMFGGLS